MLSASFVCKASFMGCLARPGGHHDADGQHVGCIIHGMGIGWRQRRAISRGYPSILLCHRPSLCTRTPCAQASPSRQDCPEQFAEAEMKMPSRDPLRQSFLSGPGPWRRSLCLSRTCLVGNKSFWLVAAIAFNMGVSGGQEV